MSAPRPTNFSTMSLIAALNVLNVLNLRHAMRSKTGNDHRRARTQVSRTHRCTPSGIPRPQ